MKFALTITDATPSELASLLATLGGSTSGAAIHAAITTAAAADDDNEDTTGDNAAVAPGTIDANGLTWDDRIHSTPAALTDKGVWRAKRGVGKDKAFVAAVEAELKAKLSAAPTAAPVQQYQPQPAPTFDPNAAFGNGQPAPVYQQPAPVYQAPQPTAAPAPQYQQPAPVQQQQPVYQQPAPTGPVPPQPGQFDFNAFMTKIQQLLQMRDASGALLIDAAYLANVSQRVGAAFQTPVNAITDLMQRPDMIDYAIQMMFGEGKWA